MSNWHELTRQLKLANIFHLSRIQREGREEKFRRALVWEERNKGSKKPATFAWDVVKSWIKNLRAMWAVMSSLKKKCEHFLISKCAR